MDVTDLVSPIASSDGNERELGSNKSTLDGNLDFLSELDTETDVTVLITDGDDGLESGSLTGLGLLLDGHDFHGLVRELSLGSFEEQVNDLRLLNGNGVSVDLLKGLDVVVLDESAKLGQGSPLLVVTSGTSWAATGAISATATSTATTTTSITESASLGTTTFAAFHLSI
jgi:hypothetical protein